MRPDERFAQREKAFILGVMGIGKGSLGGLPPRSPCPAGGSYPRVGSYARAESVQDIVLAHVSASATSQRPPNALQRR